LGWRQNSGDLNRNEKLEGKKGDRLPIFKKDHLTQGQNSNWQEKAIRGRIEGKMGRFSDKPKKKSARKRDERSATASEGTGRERGRNRGLLKTGVYGNIL